MIKTSAAVINVMEVVNYILGYVPCAMALPFVYFITYFL